MNNYFLGGFIAGEGCFGYSKKKVWFQFAVDVDKRDKPLLLELQKALDCGTVRSFPSKPNMVRYQVGGRLQLREKVLPFLDKYLLDSYKRKQYEIWKKRILDYKPKRKSGGGMKPLGNT